MTADRDGTFATRRAATAEQGNGGRMTSAVSDTWSLTRPDLLGPLLCQATGDGRWRQVEASLITGGKSNLTISCAARRASWSCGGRRAGPSWRPHTT